MLEPFLLRAILAGAILGIVAAPLGCLVVWRRMAYFGSTVAHAGLLGVALGLVLGIDLTLGVVLVALAIGLMLIAMSRQKILPMDSLLGILSHAALAAGLVAAARLAGQRLDLMGYLFGDILAVSQADLAWIVIGGAVVTIAVAWLWRPLVTIAVHEELAAAEGIPTQRMEAARVLLLAFTIAVAMKRVGIRHTGLALTQARSEGAPTWRLFGLTLRALYGSGFGRCGLVHAARGLRRGRRRAVSRAGI